MTDFRVLLYKIKNGLKKRARQVLEVYDLDFEIKDKYDIDDLLEVTRILRSENGCPWDREQDHKSVRMNVLEEAYEVMEAIDADDAAMLKEELGDLLFQAVFHCEIEKERGRFEFNDICDDVTKKMIYRHPHVFGDVNVNNSDDVLKNWDKLKKKIQASGHRCGYSRQRADGTACAYAWREGLQACVKCGRSAFQYKRSR